MNVLSLLPKTGHRIGRHLVAAEYNTSLVGVHSLVRCQVPQQASGFYSLEITHNGRDFTSSGLIFEHVDATINDAFPRQLNPSGGTLITVQGAGFRDGLLCRTGLQEVAVMAAVSSSALLVCETLAVQEQNLHDSIYLSIVASRQQSSLSDMYDLVIDGARVKGARSVIHLRNTRTDEIVIEGQGFDINLRNAWCKVGTLVVRGMVLSSSRLSCKLPLIARKCPPLLVSFNHVDFTAVEDIEWDSTRCISHEHSYQTPVSVEWRTFNAAWQQENVHDGLEKHMDFTNSEEALHVDDRNIQPSVYSVYPAKALRHGGIIHSFFGNSLTTQTFCRFNGFFVRSHYVSSVLALCESPAYDELGESWVVNVGDTLTGNRVIEGSAHSIDVTPHSVLLGATPESGSTAGGTLLQLTGTFNAETVQECKLSNIRIFNVRWVSSSQLECVTPAKHKGKALITIYSDRERQMTFNYMHDPYHDGLSERAQTYKSTSSSEFSRIPKIINFFPRVIGASGGTVTVAGISLSQELIQDLTGGHGSYVSSAIVLLEVNSGSSGEYASLIEPASILDPQSARLLYEDEVSTTSVHPISGSAEGGTSLVMSSDILNDVPELSCRIASFTPISGRWIGSTLAECISPAHRVETVVVGIANGLVTTVMPSDVKYAYHSTSVSLVGNVQQVDLIKEDWIESAHGGCTPRTQYDTSVRKRSQHEVTTFDMTWTILASACNASPHNSGFQAAVVDGNRGMNAQVQYYYVSTPTVLAVIPQIVDSGRQHPVHVMGNNFDKATLFCTSGSIRTPATMISSAIVICELPEHDDGEVLVSVGARQASMNVGVVTFYEHSEVIDVLPASGPDEGGTLVSVTMRQTKVTPWQCKFGTVGPIAGREAMDTAFQCVSPARHVSTSSFCLHLDNAISYMRCGLFFSHVHLDYPLFTIETLALNSEHLLRLFSSSMPSSKIIYHSSTTLADEACLVESHLQGVVDVGFHTVRICDYFLVELYYGVQPEITHAFPLRLLSSSPHNFLLFGRDFTEQLSNHPGAEYNIICHRHSSRVLTCTSPILSTSSYIDLEPRKFAIDGSDIVFDVADITPLYLQQTSGLVSGGKTVGIVGAFDQMQDSITCKFGSISPITATRTTSTKIECVTPAHKGATVQVGVGFHGGTYEYNSLDYKYVTECAMLTILPMKGPSYEKFVTTPHREYCSHIPIPEAKHFDSVLRRNSKDAEWKMSASSPGFVSWAAVFGVQTTPENSMFEYVYPMQFNMFTPPHGMRDGGTLITLFGSNFVSDGLGCLFETDFVAGLMLSTVLYVCESPSLAGQQSVIIASALANFTSTDQHSELILVAPLHATSIKPDRGSSHGGANVVLSVTEDVSVLRSALRISIATFRPISSRLKSSHELEVVTPAHQSGTTNARIYMTPCRYGDKGRTFTYHDDEMTTDEYTPSFMTPEVTFLDPSRGRSNTRDGSSEFSRIPKIINFFPRVIGASGGTVTVAGISLSQELIQDLTGGHGSYVSSAIVLLEVNSGSSGEYASLIEPASILDPQSARLLYEDEVSTTSVHPISGSAEGGTSLVMSSDILNDVPELSCRIASFTPISGRWIGSTLAECISPAHRVETVVVGIANGLVTTVMPSDVKYAYHSTSVSLVGNVQQVDLIKEDWIESAHGGCTPRTQYDTSVRKRSQHEVTTFDMTWTILASACNASPHNSGFQAAVVDGNRGMNAQVQYYYVSTPTVLAVIPQIVDSGRQHPVHVMGNNFDKATLFCTSGSIRTPATMISSAIVICELPEHDDGEVLVSVGARQASMNVGVVTFYEHSEVIDVLPASGPDEGGTLVSVTMRQTKVTPWQCKFGTVGPIAGREAMDTAFQCVSPARLFGPCSFAAVVSSTSNSYSSIYLFHGAPDSAVGALPTHASITDLHPCSMKSLMVESTLISARSVVFDDHTKSFCMEFSSTVGFAAVIVSNSKPRRSSFLTNIQIEVTEAPVFHEIVPDSVVSSGGSLIQLFGENMISRDLLNAHHCMFAHTTKPAHMISSAVITCEVPAVPSLSASDVNDTSTEKTMRAPSLGSRMGIEQMYRYFDFPSLERLVPERGPSRGGTRLHLHGAHFSNSRDLSCKLGTLMVRAALISEQEILCITPSHEHDSVVVDVSINGREGSGGVRMFDFLI